MKKLIDRTQYTELNLLLWDRADRYISHKDAFATYEKRWSYLDEEAMTEHEKCLLNELILTIGNGHLLAA